MQMSKLNHLTMLLPINDIITSLSLMCDHVIESWLLVKFKHLHMFAMLSYFITDVIFFICMCVVIFCALNDLHGYLQVTLKLSHVCAWKRKCIFVLLIITTTKVLLTNNGWTQTCLLVFALKSPINYIIAWKFFN
jgi:hypothetical protein